MSLTNIKLNSQRGFTIVELLIVVVVIAILAAITIVSYNGITNNAKKSSAQAAATTFAKKAELYQADQSRYPVALTDLNGSSDSGKAWFLTGYTGTFTTTAAETIASAPTDPGAVKIVKCGTTPNAAPSDIGAGNITGLKVLWWDYTATTSQVKTVSVGNTAGTGVVCP